MSVFEKITVIGQRKVFVLRSTAEPTMKLESGSPGWTDQDTGHRRHKPEAAPLRNSDSGKMEAWSGPP